jgi:metallo-beta-lactamase class B VIM
MSMHGQAPPAMTGTVVDTAWEIAPDIEVRLLAPGVWLHTSYYTYPGNVRVPSNGLMVQSGDSLLIVDSAWGELLTQRLVEWIEVRFDQRISAVLVTHSHYDRIAGTTVFRQRGARVVAHQVPRWIPDAGILFGGCAVRAASANSLENVAHADLTQWAKTLRRAQERYGAARIVVPGHGDPGDVGLLAHTLSLFSR